VVPVREGVPLGKTEIRFFFVFHGGSVPRGDQPGQTPPGAAGHPRVGGLVKQVILLLVDHLPMGESAKPFALVHVGVFQTQRGFPGSPQKLTLVVGFIVLEGVKVLLGVKVLVVVLLKRFRPGNRKSRLQGVPFRVVQLG
jgi:hypothetical protein